MERLRSYQRSIFFTSLIFTIIIFSFGLLLTYFLDYARISSVLGSIQQNELNAEAYFLEERFADLFNSDKCSSMNERIYDIKKEMVKVAQDLSNYGSKSLFKKNDFDYLKRRYFLLELRFYGLVNNLNEKCGYSYVPILFFYKIDDDVSIRQGYVLDDLNQVEEYKSKIVTLSFDKDYMDEPSLELLLLKFNITDAPTIVIDNKIKREGIMYTGEINASIIKLLRNVEVDRFADSINFSYVLDSSGIDVKDYENNLRSLLSENISDFARGDIYLILGRLSNNKSVICSSLGHYFNYTPSSLEEEALVSETVASVGCGANRKAFLLKASSIWSNLSNDFRSELDRSLAFGNSFNFKFEDYPLRQSIVEKNNISQLIIGSSFFRLTSFDILVSQADRVSRDWLSYQLFSSPFSDKLLTVFSERLFLDDSELLPEIGWHEGARIKELKGVGLSHLIASGTVVRKLGDKWFAPNEDGVFMFDVPFDKVFYPTTRFLSEDLAVVVDTHGVNMLVEQAVRYNATVVVGCCDNIGKIKAVQYLSDKGIRSVCFTDKYLPLVLGSNISALGSPPIRLFGDSAVLGNQPIVIGSDEQIIVEDIEDAFLVPSYYDTPARYFRILQNITSLNVAYFKISGMDQMSNIVGYARNNNVHIIAARVYNSDDYSNLKNWLSTDINNRAVLFHSAAYPFGYKLLKEFPLQVSFDDVNPVFV